MKPACFTVTIDVEADNVWDDQASLSLKNLDKLTEFQALCDSYGIKPSYLLSYETLSDPAFIDFLKDQLDRDKIEVGIHPHVWTIPSRPNLDARIDTGILGHYQSMLPETLLYEKLELLHNKVQELLGLEARIHRAGRWGLCVRTIDWLERKGYLVDTSVVPLRSFQDTSLETNLHPDYYAASQYPYKMSAGSILKPGNLGLIEIPTTNTNWFIFPAMVRFVDKLKRDYHRNLPKAVLIKLKMYPLELRPFPDYAPGTLPGIIRTSLNRGLPVINLMFHSSELLEGASPYSSTTAKTERIWYHIEESFRFVRERQLVATGLLEAVTRLKEARYFD